MAEQTEVPFGLVSGVDPRNRAGILDVRAHWRQLANAVEKLYAAAMGLPNYFGHSCLMIVKTFSPIRSSTCTWPLCVYCLFSPLSKPADRAIYFACVNFFLFF